MSSVISRYIVTGLAALTTLISISSCKKDKQAPGTASLTVINAVVGSRALITNFKGGNPFDYYNSDSLQYGVFNPVANSFGSYSGQQTLALYQFPDTTEKSKPLFNLVLDLPIGSMQSLYLTGTPAQPDTVFTKDAVPYLPAADSNFTLQFVNLSQGVKAVNINIQGKAGTPEVSSLPYKGITGFRTYSGRAAQDEYVFEFRDPASGTVIASQRTKDLHPAQGSYISPWLYQNFTLALIGKPGGLGNDSLQILMIKH
ncbi:hypothetical protein [Chitinophaga sp. 212800010-3]|uniref:hypothetical protein n=1 Tax=unclassified Chitinophaga TaxID=2619133 RepID=UPI002DE4513B|nr:DUF4397 domain-containing protein [Chitinophaga sp. 212800010-3]